jgi:hypothetical protein
VEVTGTVIPARLIVNGQDVSPPTSHVVPAVVSATITPTVNGTILPLPLFSVVTINAPTPVPHVGQTLYASYAAHGDQWFSLAPPFQGTPPRLVLGEQPVTMRFMSWVARSPHGSPHIAVLWVDTPSAKPSGIIATTVATPVGPYTLNVSAP